MTARTIRRLVAAMLAPLLAIGLISPAGAVLPDPQGAVLDWLESELADGGGKLTIAYESWDDPPVVIVADDWGLTIDAVLVLAAGGRGAEAPATTVRDLVEASGAQYFTGAASGYPSERYAGPLAKTMFMALVLGDDTTSFGGFDLEPELRALMQTSGPDVGRFSDLSDPGNEWGGDYSNGFGQAFALLALERTSGGAPAEAVAFLLDQQCPGGGFRGTYTPSGGCTDDAAANVDYTAFAVMALLATTPDCATSQAVTDAVAWLLDQQAGDGSFPGDGGVSSSNTTGLATSVLDAFGYDVEAAAGAAFVAGLQVESGDDLGAIARDVAGLATAADGIQQLERDGFRRATVQAVLGLGLPTYAEMGSGVPDIDPAAFAPCVEQPTPTTEAPATDGPTPTTVAAPGGPGAPAAQPVVTRPTYTG